MENKTSKPDGRHILVGHEARMMLKSGLDFLADIIRVTLGPSGRNAIWEQKNRFPRITNDGAHIAKTFIEKQKDNPDMHPVAFLGAWALAEATERTNNAAGDGTTTTAVFAQKVVHDSFERLGGDKLITGSRANVMALFQEIHRLKREVVAKLKAQAKPVETIEDLKRVARVAIENPTYGDLVAEMRWEIGKEGHIAVEDYYLKDVETEVHKGMKFHGVYLNPFLMPMNEKKEMVLNNVHVLVTNQKLETGREIMPLVEKLWKEKQESKLAIIGERYERPAVDGFVLTNQSHHKNAAQFPNVYLPVKAPSLTPAEFEDVSCFVGGKFINSEKGEKVENAEVADLGFVSKITATPDDVILVGGKGQPLVRIERLREEMKTQTREIWVNKYLRRIASLSAAVGIIKVGAPSEIERYYWYYKFQDAENATRAALEDGVVLGGGRALLSIAEDFKDTILYNALRAPYEQIQENAGGHIEFGEDIVDPVKVVIAAVENACSVAGTLITAETAMADRKERSFEDLLDALRRQE